MAIKEISAASVFDISPNSLEWRRALAMFQLFVNISKYFSYKNIEKHCIGKCQIFEKKSNYNQMIWVCELLEICQIGKYFKCTKYTKHFKHEFDIFQIFRTSIWFHTASPQAPSWIAASFFALFLFSPLFRHVLMLKITEHIKNILTRINISQYFHFFSFWVHELTRS